MDADIYLSLQNYGDANCIGCMTEINIEYDGDGNLEYEGGMTFRSRISIILKKNCLEYMGKM
ncbi:hypothetical protein [Marixanthomonas ophiurae]|uniref:hypothetical protein n=1 Tax=Marixanthomonas ophiurae TaxID=387659 RepID=UPI0013149817|nr:hypothetical protein [Marixanthomonas ophiurae]